MAFKQSGVFRCPNAECGGEATVTKVDAAGK